VLGNTNTLKLLNIDRRVWIKAPDYGFVGVGRVAGLQKPASSCRVETMEGEMPILDALKDAKYHREHMNDPERCEYFVPIRWLDTVEIGKAINELGLFGNRNTVCRPIVPKWRFTVDRLKEHFTKFADEPSTQSLVV
jgi:hypothetical protein